MARNPNLSEQNRAMFRSYAPADVWQQMALYGMNQGGVWPGTADIPHKPEESEFLAMMLKAFKEQEDEKRRQRQMSGQEHSYKDPIIEESRQITGR